MIGVVVWSSVDKEKAVIWCEDHAALAYLQGRENLASPASWPQPGDLVELESEIVGALRNARRVSLLSEQEFAHLPGMLRASAPPAEPHLRIVSSTPQPESRDQLAAGPALRAAAAS
ncbi:hypothetical protein ACFOM8_10790 [Paracoccus angustae]|uniref:Uncharacterized protein n=1 Tax=Paracoccus angustae TaxID=1671480 RepID=A0ABV7U4P3_9RHOB